MEELRPMPLNVNTQTWNGTIDSWQIRDGKNCPIAEFEYEADAHFHVLARQAEDVLIRRGWSVCHREDGWVCYENTSLVCKNSTFEYPPPQPTPFLALVKTDEWYKEHVEAP